jgi:hypothetical protein
MTMLVFVGPTLRAEEVAAAAPDAICLPPAAQGDVYRVARKGPSAIGIIDGYFSGAPSVWHKEILWALSEGVPVFGSASMGALRAAELHTFGMRGVGRIFEAFRQGELEDDDEVAVVHGPAETGFLAASEPMVNIRATLAQAEADRIISAASRSQLETAAKSLFFPHRTWPAVLRAVAGEDGMASEFARLEKWLPDGAIDQKRADALEMLAAMSGAAENDDQSASFRFEWTHFWDDLVDRTTTEATKAELGSMAGRILDELRLLGPDAYRAAMKSALARLLAEREAERLGFAPPQQAKAAVTSEHRTNLGLYRRNQLDAWMSQHGLDQGSYDRLMEREALLRQFIEANAAILAPYLLDELRLSGQYINLTDRANDKCEMLATARHQPHEQIHNLKVRAWYFEQCLRCAMPDDIHAFAKALGYSTAAELDRALHDEFVYTYSIRRSQNGPEAD